jgi:hypothetical protein
MTRTSLATAVAIAAAAFGLVLLVWLVVWPRWAGERLDKVVVTWAGPPKCTGTEVQARGGPDPVPVIVAQPSMHCVVTVRITNRGKHEVTVTRLIAPLLGPDTGATVIGAALDGVEPRAEPTFAIDAIYDLDLRLPGGATHTMQVAFVFNNKHGCGPAYTFDLYNWPVVEVSALGKSAKRAPSETLHFRHVARFGLCRGS